ncbi:MAG: saccharopine dehydrogenase C-terminal domain-containing protein [Bacteroides sp.]|jgi:saccharopine dehydrogenase-like NADP-dependent oxidoreductase|nr:saccharopine dehydrogenase C-terminal domain-containing protein [Bacteroides sp.]
MSNIVVLGAGMVGKAIAIDLSAQHQVTSADIDKESLEYLSSNYPIHTQGINLMEEERVAELVKDCDLVISAVPGFMGFDTLRTVIEAGKNIVDISFMPEDFMELNALAAQKGVTAITDCGVAPGVPNLIVGYHNELMDVENFEYVVGGLPRIKIYPFYYKAPFSPIDVIEEYTRPARYVEKGQLLTKPAMSEPELMFFEKVGTLEAFYTDGLRSLLSNMEHIPNMREKTLRYPGHIQLILALKTAGFFEKTPITINNTAIRPIDFTSKVLIDDWKLGPEEPEFTVMRIEISGKEEGQNKKIVYNLYDAYDPGTKLSSMARTTGFTATACAELVLQGRFAGKGVFPPELLGMDPDNFEFVMDYLAARKVIYNKTETKL